MLSVSDYRKIAVSRLPLDTFYFKCCDINFTTHNTHSNLQNKPHLQEIDKWF